MNERERKLLDKQLWGVSPSPPERGALALAFVGVFLGGLFIGAMLFPHDVKQTRMTAPEVPIALSLLDGSEPNLR